MESIYYPHDSNDIKINDIKPIHLLCNFSTLKSVKYAIKKGIKMKYKTLCGKKLLDVIFNCSIENIKIKNFLKHYYRYLNKNKNKN